MPNRLFSPAGDNQQVNNLAFNPGGGWLATSDLKGLAIWPLGRQYPCVIRRHDLDVTRPGVFSGRRLARVLIP